MANPAFEPREMATWRWLPDTGRLQVDVPDGSPVGALAGDWAIADFRHLFEGLSVTRLKASFQEGVSGDVADVVNCALSLKGGLRVQMVGGYLGEDEARGIVLVDQGPHGDARPAIEDEPQAVLDPVFQPIFETATRRLVGFEALARWTGHAPVDPRLFEDPGLATAMLLKAGDFAESLKAALGPAAPFIGVNLTAKDIARPDLPDLVGEIIAARGLAPKALVVELTEQAALRDLPAAVAAAERLKAAGAGLMLDDFGAGQSSFVWLAEIVADGVKLDADLIARCMSERGGAVLEAMTQLAERLAMSTTAEGVERDEQAERLSAIGLTRMQGFGLCRPLKLEAALAYATGSGVAG